jgi:hypothetical protein
MSKTNDNEQKRLWANNKTPKQQPRTLKKEQDEEQRTKHILLKRYNDNFEHRKQEQRTHK